MELVRKLVEQLGYKVILKSDNEPAILALKEAERREASAEIVVEDSAVGDHQADGVAENAVKNVQGQVRALESRINKRVEGDHQAVPWRVMHVATVISKGRKDDEGFRPHRRSRQKE